MKMDRVYRSLLTICLILGVQIHLPVTMFPASDIGTMNKSFLGDKQVEFGIKTDTLHWSRNEVDMPHRKVHDRNIPNHEPVIGSDYKGLNGIKRNQFYLKGLMGFRESDPVNYEEINTHLSVKNDFIRE